MQGFDLTALTGGGTAAPGEGSFDRASRDPELRLMLAVLEDAITRVRASLDPAAGRSRRHLREVMAWIDSRDLESPFSFENVCSALGFDAGYIRAGLAAWKTGEATALAPLPRWRVRRGCGHDDKASQRRQQS